MINFDQLYLKEPNKVAKIVDTNGSSSMLNSMEKLSVFVVTNETRLFVNDDDFLRLFHEHSENVYFVKRTTKDIVCWDVYADVDCIKSFMDDKLVELGTDFILWPTPREGSVHKPPSLLVFDMDSTFIEIEVIDELANRHGVGESVAKVTEAAMRGELDFAESLISRVSCLVGLKEVIIDDICAELPLSKGVKELTQISEANKVNIAIVSGGFTPFVDFVKNDLNLYQVKANNLQIENGCLTGRIKGAIVDAQAKAEFVRSLAGKLKLDSNEIMTIGDGANDLAMMKESGFSLAYRAKPTVQAKANGCMNHTNLNHLADVFGWI